jgi:hypothetical protein
MKKLQHRILEDLPLVKEEAHFVLEYCIDMNIHRVAAACNIDPERAFELRQREDISAVIQEIMQDRFTPHEITAEVLMQDFYRLHHVAMQQGKLPTALQALDRVARLGMVDAYAAEKVELKSDRDVVERLIRERKRRLAELNNPDKVIDFNLDNGPSFL